MTGEPQGIAMLCGTFCHKHSDVCFTHAVWPESARTCLGVFLWVYFSACCCTHILKMWPSHFNRSPQTATPSLPSPRTQAATTACCPSSYKCVQLEYSVDAARLPAHCAGTSMLTGGQTESLTCSFLNLISYRTACTVLTSPLTLPKSRMQSVLCSLRTLQRITVRLTRCQCSAWIISMHCGFFLCRFPQQVYECSLTWSTHLLTHHPHPLPPTAPTPTSSVSFASSNFLPFSPHHARSQTTAMVGRTSALLALAAVAAQPVDGFYIPGVAPVEYSLGEVVRVMVRHRPICIH
jgi:hypothetical protein